MIMFFIGLFIGIFLGILIMAMLSVAKNADEVSGNLQRKDTV